ncbi:MAG: zinc ribbon domain-containing protein [Oscillospiraceae bacterium]|jgi:uncharacterized membrane protein YvbJ|nr:zinc ribbon domain-containing protein [Oscillospiraceae bacterium]
MFCKKCGNKIHEEAVICTHCGCATNDSSNVLNNSNDVPSGGLKALSFLIPLVGLILFASNINTKPKSAKSYGVFALVGFIIGLIITIPFYFV